MKTLLLSVAIALTLSACGKPQETTSATPPPTSAAAANPVTAPTTASPVQAAQPSVPADDPVALAAIQKSAQAAATNPLSQTDGNDGEMQDAVSGLPLTIGPQAKRADGYPPYSITCDLASQQCTELNGMGNPIQTPITDSINAVTFVRNADVLSDAYHCGHGICTDTRGNLIGKISPAMLALHPELAH